MGSEPGFTWNWALYLSRHHRVCVLTHPQYRHKVDAFLEANPNPNVQFVWVTLDTWLDPWDPERGEGWIRLHYMLWISKAYKTAQRLCEESEFHVAHHVSWSTVGAPPSFWRLPVPSVWGPIGGAQCVPLGFVSYFGRGRWFEIVRTCYVRLLRFSPVLRKAAKSSSLIFATNRDTKELLSRVAGNKVHLFLDCGLPPDSVPADVPPVPSSEDFTLLWAGRLERRKALSLALRALARGRQTRVTLLVAGSGALRPELELLAGKLGLANRVEFLGFIPYESMQSVFRRAHAFLFTALRDSFGSVVLEAMAHALPIVTLDHQGVGTFVPEGAGIKVPVTTPRETIDSLAVAIDELSVSDPLRLVGMQLASWNFAKSQTWDRRAQSMTQIYEDVVSARAHGSDPVRANRSAALDPGA